MEEIVHFRNDGAIKYSYRRDGTSFERECQHLFAAYERLSNNCKIPLSISSEGGKQLSFYPVQNNELIVYLSEKQYHADAILSLLKSHSTMLSSFLGSFSRPIHIEGLHLHNIFEVPRVYAHPENNTTKQLLNELKTVVNSPLCALYTQNMIVLATDEYWKMSKRDLHAVDLLVRHCESPFTDQVFIRENGRTDRVIVFLVQGTMRFVTIGTGGFNSVQAATTLLPAALHKRIDFLKSIEAAPDVIAQQLGLLAWVIVDAATPRFFGFVPPELENKFINLVCKCNEIADKSRITDMSLLLEENRFFYMPKVKVKKTFYYDMPHVWDIYFIHNMKKDEAELRKFSMETMLNLVQFLRPVNVYVSENK